MWLTKDVQRKVRGVLLAGWRAFVAAVLYALSGHVAELHAEKAALQRALEAQSGKLSALSLNSRGK